MRYFLFFLLLNLLGCHSNKLDKAEHFTVGTKSFIWKDLSRTDPHYGGFRLVNVRVWYPGDINVNDTLYEPTPYYYEIDKVYKKLMNWSDDDFNFVSNITTKSLSGYPISKQHKKLPVLLLSPSLGGNLSMYTYYAEHLAQNGFVVIGVNHLYESEYVIDVDNQIYSSNHKFHDSLKSLNIPKQITADDYRKLKEARHKVLGEDLVFCLNKLEEINVVEFNGLLDLQRVGAFGHSIGGAASIYASLLDKRLKAIANIDGTPPYTALQNGIDVPFIFIEDLIDYKNNSGHNIIHIRRSNFCKLNRKESYRVLLANTNHNSFLDINYYLAETDNEKKEALNTLNNTAYYLSMFFNIYLNGKNLELNATVSDSLEVYTDFNY